MSRGADQIFTNVSLASRLSFGSTCLRKRRRDAKTIYPHWFYNSDD
jgi:hypothetical protein